MWEYLACIGRSVGDRTEPRGAPFVFVMTCPGMRHMTVSRTNRYQTSICYCSPCFCDFCFYRSASGMALKVLQMFVVLRNACSAGLAELISLDAFCVIRQ